MSLCACFELHVKSIVSESEFSFKVCLVQFLNLMFSWFAYKLCMNKTVFVTASVS